MLDIQRLTVHYGQAPRPALAELDLRVEGGDIVAIIGPSGAGKSTILGAAAGLVLPSEGRVEVLGVDTAVLGARRHRPVRSRIGTIQQDFALVGPMRVVHNVAAGRLGRWSAARALRSLIKPVEIDDVVASLDRVGLADRVWDRADRLSGGQQQRVAVARTLFQDPDLILADEPCSSVDPARADDVLAQLVATASKGDRALVTSLHDAQLATRHCGRIVGIKMGAVHFDLPAGDVTEGRLAELYSLEDSSVLEDDPPAPTDSAEPGT